MGLGARVKEVREDRGWSQKDLAARVSTILRRKITQVAIHHIEKRDNVMPRFVVELAQALEVSLPWLQYERGPKKGVPPRAPPTSRGDDLPQVPVRHYVGAGDEVHPFDDGGDDDAIDWEDAPPGFNRRTGSAVIVKGESMRPIFDPGDMLFFKERRNPPTAAKDLPSRPVIVQTASGTLYVKKLLPGTKRGRFHLLSINPLVPPLQDQPVESFAYIEWVKPQLY